ncbi:MAG: sulfatase [Bacillota bacterium]|nr:sulfatase [Bacillota bacterium]
MSKDRPNIILILVDDLGWKDLGCYGSQFYETPNIDQLSRDGLRFTDAYAACPVCSPTRASILTGKYPASVGVTDWIDWGGKLHPCQGKLIDAPYVDHLPLSEISLPRALKKGGYRTWHVGKWHLGGDAYYPEKHGFDVNIGGCHIGALGKNGYFSPYNIPTLADGPPGEYLTDRLTDEAIALMESSGDDPFFLNLWHYCVHTPIMAKPALIEKYARKKIDMKLDQVQTFAEGEYFPTEHKKHLRLQRRLVQSDPVYAAMIASLDESVGRILRALERLGKARNTLVIFTSDNGGLATSEGSPTCNSPLSEGKGWMYEGGVREPLLIRWPEVIKPGRLCSQYVTSPDFYPTLLEAASLDLLPEQHQDGCSLMPLLRGDDLLERGAIFWHYPHYGNQGGTPGVSMRLGDYKLIEFYEDGRLELYNLRDDLEEEHNLAGELPEIVGEMHPMMRAWQHRAGAKMPLARDPAVFCF